MGSEKTGTFGGRIALTFFELTASGDGYLISNEPLNRLFTGEEQTWGCINVWFKKPTMNGLPAIGFTILPPNELNSQYLEIDPTALNWQHFLVCHNWTDQKMPQWCRLNRAKIGDRLRVLVTGQPNDQQFSLRLNTEQPAQPQLITSDQQLYLILKVTNPKQNVAVLYEDEVSECHAKQLLPFNRQFTYVSSASSSSSSSSSPFKFDIRSAESRNWIKNRLEKKLLSKISDEPSQLLGLCIVCRENQVDTLYAPCYHAVVCRDCSDHWAEQKKQCVACRKDVHRTYPIKLSVYNCIFDQCGQMNSVALPCCCLVGCYEKAEIMNRSFETGRGSPECPGCFKLVNQFVQIFLN